jgi:hypothetical protein
VCGCVCEPHHPNPNPTVCTTGVDLQDRLRWVYRPDGKHVWHAKKWTISVYRFVINTATVQAYIVHLMLVRVARAAFDLQFDVWRARQMRLRNSPAPVTGAEAAAKRKQLTEYQTKFKTIRPQPSEEEGEAQTAALSTPRRGRGRPTCLTTVPHRRSSKRQLNTVEVVCGADRSERKRVRAVPRLVPTKRLGAGSKKYDINSDKAMTRFQGRECIPGMHILMSVPKKK